jgi:hypothetical protein
MRITNILVRWLVAISLAVAIVAPAPVNARAYSGHDHALVEHNADHAMRAHDYAGAVVEDNGGAQSGSSHSDGSVAPCTANCCAAGMGCCVALIALPFDVRLAYGHVRLHGALSEIRAGIEPAVPLRPPRFYPTVG